MVPDWEVYLRDTAAKIVEEQSPKRLLEVRERIYELLTHCIPSEVIFKVCLTKTLFLSFGVFALTSSLTYVPIFPDECHKHVLSQEGLGDLRTSKI